MKFERIDACRINCNAYPRCDAHVLVEFDPPCTDSDRAWSTVRARAALDGWVTSAHTGIVADYCPKHARHT